jgi:hypothetical protein
MKEVIECIITFLILFILLLFFLYWNNHEQIEEISKIIPNICELGKIKEITPPNKLNFNAFNFNPNGIVCNNKLLIVSRCCEDKYSFPLLQHYDFKNNVYSNSQKININCDKPVLGHTFSGFEDMRIFQYNNEYYMIGVNLDRRTDSVPSMVLVKLDENLNNSNEIWFLNYEPLSAVPNKNWSPIILKQNINQDRDELCFIIHLDPLLIVKRNFVNNIYSENCEVFYQSQFPTLPIKNLRNSTITINWNEIPVKFQEKLDKVCDIQNIHNTENNLKNKYLLLGHTKFIERNLVIYQHYFVIIEFNKDFTDHQIYISKPFYLEQKYKPHIEYVSGICFHDDEMIIFYGLKDKESKYISISSDKFNLWYQ